MKRRAAVLAVAAWPLRSRAQSGARTKPALVAVLGLTTPDAGGPAVDVMKARLAELGWTEGRDIRYESRWAMGQLDRLPALAHELVALGPDLIWVVFSPAALAAKSATATIPIVFASSFDPVGLGLAGSLARPGGNATGLSNQAGDFAPKLLQMLRQLLPLASRVGLIGDWSDPSIRLLARRLEPVASALRLTLVPAPIASPDAVGEAFGRMQSEGVDAVFTSTANLSFPRIADFATRGRLPLVCILGGGRGEGSLIDYGPVLGPALARSAEYVDRILRGARPAEMPIEQPTKFELRIDLRRARALGITVPRELRLLADVVIE